MLIKLVFFVVLASGEYEYTHSFHDTMQECESAGNTLSLAEGDSSTPRPNGWMCSTIIKVIELPSI